MHVFRLTLLAPIVLAIAGAGHAAEPPAASQDAAKVQPLLTRTLPDVPGKEAMMLTVEYPPGAASPPHRHNANTFVYVLEGAVVMQVAGGEAVTVNVGETFYESPTDVHSVSRNASTTRPARFLVLFVKDEGAPASLPVD